MAKYPLFLNYLAKYYRFQTILPNTTVLELDIADVEFYAYFVTFFKKKKKFFYVELDNTNVEFHLELNISNIEF